MAPTKLSVALAEEFLDFVDASPSRTLISPAHSRQWSTATRTCS